jgi:hypothetical protein
MRRLRTAGPLLTAAAALALAVPAAPAASAAPVPAVAGSAPRACATPPLQAGPVRVTVLRLEPRTIRPGDPVRVMALLQNCGSAPLARLRVRLRTGTELVTRTQLTQADTQPLADRAAAPWQDGPATLATGQTVRVQYEASAASLRLTTIGVYPAELTVQGFPVQGFPVQGGFADGTGPSQVGVVRTYLPFFPDRVAAPTEVSWLLPFADRPHRYYDTGGTGSPVLVDDRLAGSLTGNGRLNRLLTIAERADTAGVPFTLGVDPDLIDTVHDMTLGYQVQVSSRATTEGTGKQAATIWLNRMIGLASQHDVIALPYADADLVALASGGLAELVQTRRETLQALASQLHTTVKTQLAWPAGGLLNDKALDAVLSQGAQAVVLDAEALPNAPAAARTQSAASPLPSVHGNGVALVADGGLSQVVSGAVPVAGGARLAEQRYLAELAMITAEAPSAQRRVLVAPPHGWSPNPDAASRMLQDTRDVPWLTAGSVTDLARSRELVQRGALSYRRDAPGLAPEQVTRIRKLRQMLDQFGTVLNNVADNRLLGRYTPALQRAASAFWRTAPGMRGSPEATAQQAGSTFLTPIANRITTVVQNRVYIVKPQDGKYSLASQHSQLPLTVVNDLDVPVHVRVLITSEGTVGFHAKAEDATLQPHKRTLVRIEATVTQSGRFQVTAGLHTPDGRLLNRPVTLRVQSTAYGVVAMAITGAAFGLLLLLLARRVVRRVRPGSGPPVQPAGSPAERAHGTEPAMSRVGAAPPGTVTSDSGEPV